MYGGIEPAVDTYICTNPYRGEQTNLSLELVTSLSYETMAVSSSPTKFFELLLTLSNSEYLLVVFHDQSFETKKEPNHAYCLRFNGKKKLWYIQDPMKHANAA